MTTRPRGDGIGPPTVIGEVETTVSAPVGAQALRQPHDNVPPGTSARRDAFSVPPRRTRRWPEKWAVVVCLVAVVALFSGLRPATFATVGNLESVLTTQATLLILALLLTVVLAAGDLDLSIGGMLGFTSVFVAVLTVNDHLPFAVGLLVSLAVAVGVGLTNAFFIVRLRVNSLITTLAMGTILDGLSTAISNATTIGDTQPVLQRVMITQVLGIGLPFWYAVVLLLILGYVLSMTRSGRYLYFTGEGREAARLIGIPVNRIRTRALVLSAFGAWLAGVVLLGQTGAAQSGLGDPYLLPAYAAVFLGAATIKPGRFNPVGTFVAVLLLAAGTTGLEMFNSATWVSDVFDGGILIVAVALSTVLSGRLGGGVAGHGEGRSHTANG